MCSCLVNHVILSPALFIIQLETFRRSSLHSLNIHPLQEWNRDLFSHLPHNLSIKRRGSENITHCLSVPECWQTNPRVKDQKTKGQIFLDLWLDACPVAWGQAECRALQCSRRRGWSKSSIFRNVEEFMPTVSRKTTENLLIFDRFRQIFTTLKHPNKRLKPQLKPVFQGRRVLYYFWNFSEWYIKKVPFLSVGLIFRFAADKGKTPHELTQEERRFSTWMSPYLCLYISGWSESWDHYKVLVWAWRNFSSSPCSSSAFLLYLWEIPQSQGFKVT